MVFIYVHELLTFLHIQKRELGVGGPSYRGWVGLCDILRGKNAAVFRLCF